MGCTMSETAMTQKVNDLSTELNRTKEELARCSRRYQHAVRETSEMQMRHANELQLAQMKNEAHAGLTVREVGETAAIILTDSGVMVSSSGKGQSKPAPRKVKERQNKMEEEFMNKQAKLEERIKKVTQENSQLKTTLGKIKSKLEAAVPQHQHNLPSYFLHVKPSPAVKLPPMDASIQTSWPALCSSFQMNKAKEGPVDKKSAQTILENTHIEATTKPEEMSSKETPTMSADNEESIPPPDEKSIKSRETTEEKEITEQEKAKIAKLTAKVGELKEKLKEKTLDLAAKQIQLNEQAMQMFDLENEIASQKIQARKLKKDLPGTRQEKINKTEISFFNRAVQFFIQLYNNLLFYKAKFLPSLVSYM